MALDCNNGAGALLGPRLLEAFGCEVVPLYTEPERRVRPRIRSPCPRTSTPSASWCRESKADVGFVQDADADRLAIVNERGEPLGEELTLALAVRHVLGKRRGSVVCNLSSPRLIDDLAAERGRQGLPDPHRRDQRGREDPVGPAARGHRRRGQRRGHRPPVHPCRDSFAAMALILESMAATKRKVSDLQKSLPRYVMLKDRIGGSAEQANRLIGRLKKVYEPKGRIDLTDGLKVDFPDHWIHVRPSNTEPIIRVLAEARTRAKAESALAGLKDAITTALGKA